MKRYLLTLLAALALSAPASAVDYFCSGDAGLTSATAITLNPAEMELELRDRSGAAHFSLAYTAELRDGGPVRPYSLHWEAFRTGRVDAAMVASVILSNPSVIDVMFFRRAGGRVTIDASRCEVR